MLCSDCNTNTAVVFIDIKDDKKGTTQKLGYCYNCAKKRGINPFGSGINNVSKLSDEDINNMTKQLNTMFKDLSENLAEQGINPEDIDEMTQNLNSSFDSNVDNIGNENGPMGFAVPLGSLFSNMMGNKDSVDGSQNSSKTERTQVKTNTKESKKRKFLNSFGTNLTEKARQGKVDKVIGRDKEIARVVQILNRRTKNNPCLIGEPGVGKTAIAQGLAERITQGDVNEYNSIFNKTFY